MPNVALKRRATTPRASSVRANFLPEKDIHSDYTKLTEKKVRIASIAPLKGLAPRHTSANKYRLRGLTVARYPCKNIVALLVAYAGGDGFGYNSRLTHVRLGRSPSSRFSETENIAPLFESLTQGMQIPCSGDTHNKKFPPERRAFFIGCAGRDSNPRSPKAPRLQRGVIDRSTTDALFLRNAEEISS